MRTIGQKWPPAAQSISSNVKWLARAMDRAGAEDFDFRWQQTAA